MPYYVKVTPKVRAQILPDYTVKPKSKDGNYLLFQSDLIGINGNTLQERVDNVGGALLTPDECKAERMGTVEAPAKCYTPAEYGGDDKKEETASKENTSSDETSTEAPDSNTPVKSTQDVVIPPVIVDSPTEESTKEASSEDDSKQNADTDKKDNNQKESEVDNE